jgi:outer membrane protein assembly factor BamB
VQDSFELWDFVIDLDGSLLETYSISAVAGFRQGVTSVRVTGTPSAVSSHQRLQVFVRSDAGRLVEFRSTDGKQWENLPVSQGKIGGNAGAVLSGNEDSVVYATDPIGYLTEFREIGGVWHGRRISRICGEAERWPRPVVCGQQVRIFDLDVAV